MKIVMLDRLEVLLQGSDALYLEPRDIFDAAIIGITETTGSKVIAYDRELAVAAIASQDGWDEDVAREWFYSNIASAHVGRGTPIFIGPAEQE